MSKHLPKIAPFSPYGEEVVLMTNEQKSTILHLRSAGCKYVSIAETVGLSINTVNSYCRRQGLALAAEKTSVIYDASRCKQCGQALVTKPGSKPKKFCSDKCRNAWWKTHPNAENRKAYYCKICAHCGKSYTVYGRPNSKFCCHACSAQHRTKMAEADI